MEDDDRDRKEYNEEENDVEEKVKQLAKLFKESQHIVFYTGAGISTSAKIPDFRGPQGVWTLREKGKAPKMEITIEQAIPTAAHLALVELQNNKIMKYLVSQNVDGLHRRSGIKPQCLSELHGNVYLEICEDCGTEYLRSYAVTDHCGDEIDMMELSFSEIRHMTGRRCEKKECKGILRDSIIDFGENLPSYQLKMAEANSKLCDLAIVLGSSLTVSPACELPKLASKLVIVNLQKTSFDDDCVLRIYSTCDKVMTKLMEYLELNIPEFQEEKRGDTLIYQPEDPNARFLRKYVERERVKPDGITSIEGVYEKPKNSCVIL